MDLYILDSDFIIIKVLDTYTSLIWTDRYSEYGDFEICMPMLSDTLNYIKQGNYITRTDSEHSMIIEKLLINSSIDEGATLTVTGRSLESILERRIVWGQMTISGYLQDGINLLLNSCIISPSNIDRKISNFVFQKTTDPLIENLKIDAQYTGDNLYEIIKNICLERFLGFKVTLDHLNQFVFTLYSGVDRSYNQTKNSFVIFSPGFDNLISSEYIESRAALRNVTLIGGEGNGSNRRYANIGSVKGMERRELFTDARDISSDMNEDLTSLFDFSQYPSQVYDSVSNSFVVDELFNSSSIDVSGKVGRTISLSIPQYNNSLGTTSGYATIFVDENKNYISTVLIWEKYDDSSNSSGTLQTYDFLIPDNAKYLYTSMFSQKAIDDEVYYGELNSFSCSFVKLSDVEYMEQLKQRGNENLSGNIDIVSFEGEAETTGMFKYGEDFFNGDVVQLSDGYGHETRARIIEIVTSDDVNGFSVYPTFSVEGSNSD